MEPSQPPTDARLSRRTTLRAAAIGAVSVWAALAVLALAVAPAVAASGETSAKPPKPKAGTAGSDKVKG